MLKLKPINTFTLTDSEILIVVGLVAVALLVLVWLTYWLARRPLWQRWQALKQSAEDLVNERDALIVEKHTIESHCLALQKDHSQLERDRDLLNANHGHLQQRFEELKSSEAVLKQEAQNLLGTKQEAMAEAKGKQERLTAFAEKIAALEAELKRWQDKWEILREENAKLAEARVQLSSHVEEKERGIQAQRELFEQQKKDLTDRFQALANEILDKKSQALAENNKQGLQAVINPFQQSIDAFKKEVQEIHHRESTQRGELRKELEHLKELNLQITTEAHELSTALRGQKKLQGNWGELVLENVLDRSGLQMGKDYEREVSFNTELGRQRPDAIVYLPQNKHLIIDAKVSLNAYTRFVNSEDEQERQLALLEHVRAMSDRIRELADRDYYKIPGLNSPEVVFMFVPIESAFVEALKADEGLFQSALEKNVLVATPTTLLTSLNIVRQLWRYEDQNKHTAALAEKAEGVFKKLNTFLTSFENVKKGLDKANEAYSKAENQLISGKANLVKQVGEFKNLAPAIKQELPDHFTERANLEVDYMLENTDEKTPSDNMD